jgi:hypothetical protein
MTATAAERPATLIIAQGGLGDQSYNDLAFSGFKKALAETKLEGKPVESKDVVAQAADFLRRASAAGFGLVIDLEYSHGDALLAVATDYSDADYVVLNQVMSESTPPCSCERPGIGRTGTGGATGASSKPGGTRAAGWRNVTFSISVGLTSRKLS